MEGLGGGSEVERVLSAARWNRSEGERFEVSRVERSVAVSFGSELEVEGGGGDVSGSPQMVALCRGQSRV